VAGLDLDPEVSGWRRARLAPRPPLHAGLPFPPLLTQARAELETLHGRYQVEWSIEDERFRFDTRVPAGCSARVELPDGSNDEVKAGRHRFEIDLEAATP
jgi:hypothetical protein